MKKIFSLLSSLLTALLLVLLPFSAALADEPPLIVYTPALNAATDTLTDDISTDIPVEEYTDTDVPVEEEVSEETAAENTAGAVDLTGDDYTAAPHLEHIVADTNALLTLSNSAGRLDKVKDVAGLLDSEELAALTDWADHIESSYGITVYTLTLDDYTLYTDSDIFTLAEDIFDYFALGTAPEGDGMLLILSMAERDYTLIAHGPKANYYFTDYGRHLVSDEFLPYFADNNWFGGFCSYYNSAEETIIAGESGTPIDDPQYSYEYEDHSSPAYRRSVARQRVGASAVAGLIVSVITCAVFRANMKSAKLKKEARSYIPANGIRITGRNTFFIRANETRTRIQSNNGTRVGGGGTSINSRGFSGHSGKF